MNRISAAPLGEWNISCLVRGEAQLWSLPFASADEVALAALHPRLSSEEQVQADRFYFARDRALYMAAHSLLRAMLTTAGARSLNFRRNEWGKPEIENSGQGPALRPCLSKPLTLIARNGYS
jgi:4'-phosphopantetheinyl transferase